MTEIDNERKRALEIILTMMERVAKAEWEDSIDLRRSVEGFRELSRAFAEVAGTEKA